MKTKGFSDLVASDMLAKLASEDHLALFHKNYVVAEEQADTLNAKDSSAEEDEDCSMADDEGADVNDADDAEEADDNNDADDAEDDVAHALDAAVANLITASAKLDSVGFEKSASLSLKIATFVAEAAKKKSDEKKKSDKKKKDSGKTSGKSSGKSSKTDSNDARSKKKDSKDSKKDSGKSSGKASGKSGASAKKK